MHIHAHEEISRSEHRVPVAWLHGVAWLRAIVSVAVVTGCASAFSAAAPSKPLPLAAPVRVSSAARPVEPAAPSASTSLLAALDSIQPDNIKADIFFIAADALGGRDTPSLGLQIAARFIRARLQRLGWQAGAEGGYFFVYKLRQKRLDENASALSFELGGRSEKLRFARDYFLLRYDLVEAATSAPAVYCGKGSEEEFQRAHCAGCWALCFDSGGDGSGGDSDFSLRKIKGRAKSQGAAGLLLTPGPEYSGESYAERFANDVDKIRQGSVSYPSAKVEEREAEIFPVVLLGRSGAARVLSAAHISETAPAVGTQTPFDLCETRKLEGEAGLIDMENVCGLWPGSDPELGKQVIIVSAHYDHVGTRNGVVYNGADDNGSGTCGLMALAEALTHYGPMRRTVMLMWVSGEEKGLWGSKAWNEKPWLPEGCKAVADINIDMIGRNAPDKLLITPTKKLEKRYNGLTRMAESVCALEGFPELGSADSYYERSDHYNFARNGIPAAFLFSDVHEDYHQPTDDPEKIDNDKIRRVMRMVLRMLDGLQSDKLDL